MNHRHPRHHVSLYIAATGFLWCRQQVNSLTIFFLFTPFESRLSTNSISSTFLFLSIAKNAANQEKSWRKRQFICALLNKTIYYSNARVLVVVVVPILPAPSRCVFIF